MVRRIHGVRLYGPSLRWIDLDAPGYYFLATDTPALVRWMAGRADGRRRASMRSALLQRDANSPRLGGSRWAEVRRGQGRRPRSESAVPGGRRSRARGGRRSRVAAARLPRLPPRARLHRMDRAGGRDHAGGPGRPGAGPPRSRAVPLGGLGRRGSLRCTSDRHPRRIDPGRRPGTAVRHPRHGARR